MDLVIFHLDHFWENRMSVFESQTELSCTPEAAFEFLIQPENIRRISPSAMMLVFDAAPERVFQGAVMKFRVQTFGVVRQISHRISEFDFPRRFVEEQVEGPMTAWCHEHLFEPSSNGVIIVDRITFSPPGGMLGLLINDRKIRDSLEAGFDHRHQFLEKHFGIPAGARR